MVVNEIALVVLSDVIEALSRQFHNFTTNKMKFRDGEMSI